MNLHTLQSNFRNWLVHEGPEISSQLDADAGPGLGVYLNTYRAQLMACLAETFSAVHAWLGDTAFEAAAATHIDRVPPDNWTLDAYARDFPDTLQLLYAHDPEVAELARLEKALAAAFTGPDSATVALTALDGIDWERALLRLVPTLTLLPSTTNAAAIWSALAEEAAPPAAQKLQFPTQLAVWRVEYVPRYRTLDPLEAQALELIAQGLRFGQLCARLSAQIGEQAGTALAGAWLGQWLQEGIIAGIHQASGTPS